MLDIKGYKHILRVCNTYCFSTATMFAWTLLSVRFYVHCSLSWSKLNYFAGDVECLPTDKSWYLRVIYLASNFYTNKEAQTRDNCNFNISFFLYRPWTEWLVTFLCSLVPLRECSYGLRISLSSSSSSSSFQSSRVMLCNY